MSESNPEIVITKDKLEGAYALHSQYLSYAKKTADFRDCS